MNNGKFLVIGTHPEKNDIFDNSGNLVGATSAGFYGRGLPGLVHWRGDGSPERDTLLLIGGYHGSINRIPWCDGQGKYMAPVESNSTMLTYAMAHSYMWVVPVKSPKK